MNVVAGSVLSVLMAVVLFAPPRWALMGMVSGALYLTQGVALDVYGVNLFAMRFLEVAGFLRVCVRREFSTSHLNEVDRAFLWLYGYITIVFVLRSNENLASQIGTSVDAIMSYLIFRSLIGNIEDLRWFLRAFFILLVPYFLLVSVQSVTGDNPFSIVGGPARMQEFRGGWPRCLGSFRNSCLLGALGATFLPLYIGLAFSSTNRRRALIGVGLCLGIVFYSNSGGPLATFAVALLGWLIWPLRSKMVLVRRSIVGLIFLLGMMMKAPIYYLPAKVSSITGGTGWHRSRLIEMAIRDLDKWWLFGMSRAQTANWFPYTKHGVADMTNQFLLFGISAGIGGILLFVFLLTRSFKRVGKSLAIAGSSSENQSLPWGFGVMLCVHIFTWLGVTYFDQFYVIWAMQLAAISALPQNGANLRTRC
jgi:hypothetical protein